MKIKFVLVLIVLSGLMLSIGCVSESSPLEPDPDATERKSSEQVQSFTHIHGLAYQHQASYALFVSTHHGLFRIDDEDHWTWTSLEEHHHDLMGFSIKDEQTFISSGHPAEQSDLEDPIGVIISEDQGMTWQPIALHGQVDFHHFDINVAQPDVMFGVNTYGPEAGLYRSDDGGYSWERLESHGLPDDLNQVMTIVSHPNDYNRLLMGTQIGMLVSNDGGQSWTVFRRDITITGATVQKDSEKLVAYVIGEHKGLFYSFDFGQTWNTMNLVLDEDDIGLHIAIHPTDDSQITVGTYQEHLIQTDDSGNTWHRIADQGERINP